MCPLRCGELPRAGRRGDEHARRASPRRAPSKRRGAGTARRPRGSGIPVALSPNRQAGTCRLRPPRIDDRPSALQRARAGVLARRQARPWSRGVDSEGTSAQLRLADVGCRRSGRAHCPSGRAQRHCHNRDRLPQADSARSLARCRCHGSHLPGHGLRRIVTQLVTQHMQKATCEAHKWPLTWSGWPDLNRRPLRPEPGTHPFDHTGQTRLRRSAAVTGSGSPHLRAPDGTWPLPFHSQNRTPARCTGAGRRGPARAACADAEPAWPGARKGGLGEHRGADLGVGELADIGQRAPGAAGAGRRVLAR